MLIIWSIVIAFMLAICVLIYPEMETQMGDVSSMFAEMGGFSAAFGMDRLNFGEFIGFFGVECGNILGLGGAFFAALLGITILANYHFKHCDLMHHTNLYFHHRRIHKNRTAFPFIPVPLYFTGSGSLHMLWNIRILKSGRSRHRAWNGNTPLFP